MQGACKPCHSSVSVVNRLPKQALMRPGQAVNRCILQHCWRADGGGAGTSWRGQILAFIIDLDTMIPLSHCDLVSGCSSLRQT